MCLEHAMPLCRYSFQNRASQAACLIGVDAGAALHQQTESTFLPLTKMNEQIHVVLLVRSSMGLRTGSTALSVSQENPGIGPVSQNCQREGEE